MKKIFVLFTLGAIMAGCAKFSPYETFTSTDELLKLSCEFPSGWSVREFRHPGLDVSGATFFLKSKEDDAYRFFFAVTAARLPEDQRDALTLEALAKQSLGKALRLREARLVTRGGRMIDDEPAAEAVITYKGMSDIYKAGARLVPVKEKFLVLLREGEGILITIRYVNLEAKFGERDAVFSHLLDSLRFH